MQVLKHAPRLTADAAASLARNLFGVDAEAVPLPSERDQNFRFASTDGDVVLKIANGLDHRELLDAQNQAMARVARHTGLAPRPVASLAGELITTVGLPGSGGHFVRLLTWVPGRTMGECPRHAPGLLRALGGAIGQVDRALSDFDHPAIHRAFHWDLATALGAIDERLPRIQDEAMRAMIETTTAGLRSRLTPLLPALRRSVIHGDANDHNVVVAQPPGVFEPDTVTGLVDFGDIVHSFTVADPAIALAYALLDKPDPLAVAEQIVAGYHSQYPLTEDELTALMDLALLRLCLSVCIAAVQRAEEPDNAYLGISQQPIRRTLPRIAALPPALVVAALRRACGIEPAPAAARVVAQLKAHGPFAPVIEALHPERRATHDERRPPAAVVVDLSVGSPLVSGDPAGNTEPALSPRIRAWLDEAGAAVGIGRYGECRLLYTSGIFASPDGESIERRTLHLGTDLFVAPGTPVRAPLDAVVHIAAENTYPLDYGPLVVLRHTLGGAEFFTLYGHLSRESLAGLRPGDAIAAGDRFAEVGTPDVNGGWTPHLHVQVITDLLGLGAAFPGVCRASQFDLWRRFSPDPGLILRLAGGASPHMDRNLPRAVTRRREVTGPNLSLAYREPVAVARGWMQYLFDQTGRRYLDGYNNVPHVGHSHPEVVGAASEQMAILNTNTRYLHDSLEAFADRLTATLPEPLRVCYFVNSGSEANELALRLARAYTRRRNLIVLDAGYHGATTTLIKVSPYKFAGPGGDGRVDWVRVAPVPDTYRGLHRASDPEAGAKYAAAVAALVDDADRTGGLCGFLAETCPSVAGQIMLPSGYLSQVYRSVRAAGGVCIADEVQTAYGRTGTHFYAFDAHGVIPDIVVLGKPIGNGYPLGAVITTREIARTFDNGMEFFSTFGGSTVSCVVGRTVLDITMRERLQDHALHIGDILLDGLRGLQQRHPVVGDVRGSGLFLGVELVEDRGSLAPATAAASHVVNRLREEGILIGTDGPLHNVLKIRPPMPFNTEDARILVETLDRVLGEIMRDTFRGLASGVIR